MHAYLKIYIVTNIFYIFKDLGIVPQIAHVGKHNWENCKLTSSKIQLSGAEKLEKERLLCIIQKGKKTWCCFFLFLSV